MIHNWCSRKTGLLCLNKMFLIDFLGIEKFFFTVSEETNFIVFHSKDIDISSRTINERLKVERMLEYPQREQVYLETDEYMVSWIAFFKKSIQISRSRLSLTKSQILFLSLYILRRPAKFDNISKFYLKLLSSIQKYLKISSYSILLRIYEL